MSNIQTKGAKVMSNAFEPTDYSAAEGLSGEEWSGLKKSIDDAYEKWAERKGIKTSRTFNYGRKKEQ